LARTRPRRARRVSPLPACPSPRSSALARGQGWDKTYCLQFVEKEYSEIHFFGDKTFEVGAPSSRGTPTMCRVHEQTLNKCPSLP
jgi:hypothetical protein